MEHRTLDIADAVVRQLDEILEQAFGTRFGIWEHGDDGWIIVYPAETTASDSPPAYALDFDSQVPCCDATLDDEQLLTIPIGFEDRSFVATAHFQGRSAESLMRVAQTVQRHVGLHGQIKRLEEENESLVVQVTDDFEELAFLRAVSGELELTSGKYGLTHVAAKVLPLLQQTVNAQCVYLVGAVENDESLAAAGVDRVLFSTRGGLMSASQCRGLVELTRRRSALEPVVQNHFQETREGPAFPSVHEYLVVPVSKNDRLHGWLVVLNRNRNGASRFDYYWQEMRLEFGTVEAAVAQTAAAMLAAHAQNVELFRHKEQLLTDMVRALVNAIEAKDEYTRGHSERVALFALRLGRELGFDEDACERLYLTGMLHDVGKIAVDDATLRKPAQLDGDEFAKIKMHPDSGWAILHGLEHLRYVLPGVLHHHEKYDGSGYPDGLAGKDIPLDARILAVCDAYDAMTSDRTYRQGMPQEKAERILREAAGSHWDPDIVDSFFQVMPDIVEIRQTYELRPYQTRKAVVGTSPD